jgi:MSHA biogenesis protein MshJ
MKADINAHYMELTTRWRRIRRKFDARLMTERRILIVAAVCLVWFLLDTVWVTPSYQRLKKTMQTQSAMQSKQTAVASQTATLMDTLRAQKEQAVAELTHIHRRITQQQVELEEVQAQMAPAREMRQLLEALLSKHGQLRVLSMKTVAPVEVRAPGSAETVLYRHGLMLEVGGRFHDLLAWLHSAENMPRRLIWGSMELAPHAQMQLVLRVQVYTLSPDKDALEIAR